MYRTTITALALGALTLASCRSATAPQLRTDSPSLAASRTVLDEKLTGPRGPSPEIVNLRVMVQGSKLVMQGRLELNGWSLDEYDASYIDGPHYGLTTGTWVVSSCYTGSTNNDWGLYNLNSSRGRVRMANGTMRIEFDLESLDSEWHTEEVWDGTTFVSVVVFEDWTKWAALQWGLSIVARHPETLEQAGFGAEGHIVLDGGRQTPDEPVAVER